MSDLLIAPCDAKAATFAVMNWHYSKTMPVGKSFKLGIWEQKQFIGAIIYGWGANHNLSKPYGLDMTECVELVRVAMRDHKVPVSQAVSSSLKQLKKHNPGLRLVISFADPYQGHRGGIYQAGNWIYAGQSPPKTDFILNGKVLNRRAYTGQQFGSGIKSRAILPKGVQELKAPGKHRYLYPLDKGMRRQIQKLALPYPCGSGLNGETADFQSAGPGSIPGNRSNQ